MEKVSVFLGGTCGTSTWREELLGKLDSEKIDAFNPVVDDWNEECQKVEDYHRATDDVCLYVITKLIAKNGVLCFVSLDELAMYLNSLEKKTEETPTVLAKKQQ